MKNPLRSYQVVRELAIDLGTIAIPLSFLAGFLFGVESYAAAILVALCYFVMDNIVARLWVRIYEENGSKNVKTTS